MLCGSLGLAGGRILRGTAPKARRDGANASFFRIRPSVYIQAEYRRLSPTACEPCTHLQQTHTACFTMRTQRATS